MTRNEVVEKMMTAFTEEEVRMAKATRDEWFRDHPLDGAVADAGARLNRIDDALQSLKKEGVTVGHCQVT